MAKLWYFKFFFIFTPMIYCAGFLEAAEKLNILFIAADDLNCDIGCYGNTQVKTPNLDRLASLGMRFDKAYCQQPLCGPSRASVMSGMRPNTLGVFTLRDKFRGRKPGLVSLGEFFKKQGYYVGRVGKIYHYGNPSQIGSDGQDDPQTWSERYNPAGIDRTQEENIIRYPGGFKGRKGGLGISMAWWDPESEDREHTDGMVAEKAIEMIEKNKTKPFFIAAGFFNPHCPYVAPKKYFDLYQLKDIKLQNLDEAKAELKDVPAIATYRDRGPRWPYFFVGVSSEEARQCKLAYYASVSFMDAQVGKLIDALEKNDLIKNTMIVFWSDHGYFLGEKGLWYKRKAFERSVRAPLLIACPGMKSGKACFKPVELLDIYPTIVQCSGYPLPNELEGQSLKKLLNNPNSKEWDKPAISQVYYSANKQGYSIRTDIWRYTEWNRGAAGEELYNHELDPNEVRNLADKKEYEGLKIRLRGVLREYSDTFIANPEIAPNKRN